MKLIRRLIQIAAAVTVLACMAPAQILNVRAEEEPEAPEVQMIPVSYSSVTTLRVATVDVPYSDDWFKEPATSYNHSLAQASIGFAAASFRPSNYDKYFGQPDRHGLEFLAAAGFREIRSNDYDRPAGRYTISSLIGHKEIQDGDETFELIAVGICGQGYGDEWLSNLSVGNQNMHVGFNDAANDIFDRFFGYVAEHDLDEKHLKVWTVGYSRAAAVSNIFSARLSDTSWLSQEDVYSYTFATPRTTRLPRKGKYPNIFCIVGAVDPVPMIPFKDWGYDRFGTTLFTPSQETDSGYMRKKERAAKIYNELTGIDFWNNTRMDLTLQTAMKYLVDIVPTPAIYARYLQSELIDLWKDRSSINIMRKLFDISENENLINDDNRAEANELLDFILLNGIVSAGGLGVSSKWQSQASTGANVVHEHTPDLYISWMMSCDDPDDLFCQNDVYDMFEFDPDVEVTVADGEETVFVSKPGCKAVPVSDADFDLYEEGDLCTLSVPADHTYTVKVSPSKSESSTVFWRRILLENLYYSEHSSELIGSDTDASVTLMQDGIWIASDREEGREESVVDLTDHQFSASDVSSTNLSWRTIVLVFITIGVMAGGFVIFVLLALFWKLRLILNIHTGKIPKQASAHLGILFGMVMVCSLYLLLEIFSALYPSSIEIRTQFKLPIGMIMIAMIWYIYLKVPSMLHMHVYMGITLLSAGDIVINHSLEWGMILEWLGIVVLLVGFVRFSRPVLAQWIAAGIVSVIGAGAIYQAGAGYGHLVYMAIGYYVTAVALLLASLRAPKRFIYGSGLLLLAAVGLFSSQVFMADALMNVVTHLILIGFFYAAQLFLISGPLKVINVPYEAIPENIDAVSAPMMESETANA